MKTIKSLLVEIRDLLQELVNEERRTKVDVKDLVRELGSGKLIQDLRHYYIWNDRWSKLLEERNRRAATSTYDFIESQMPDALFSSNQFDVLENMKEEVVGLKGRILDLGVYRGASTRALADIFPDHQIDGFDSFEGLPDDWAHVMKGTFGDVSGSLPDVPENVRLFKGWFSETLPVWRKQHMNESIALLRVDCDIYSSTKDILDVLGDALTDRSIICFDELFGYWGWQAHEYRAFMEYIERTGHHFEYVAYGLTYCIVRLRPTDV